MAEKPETPQDPIRAFAFGLEIEGKMTGYFTEVSGIGSESEVVEHKVINESTGKSYIRKQPGRLTWGDVTLKRGVTDEMDVWEWRQQVVDGDVDEARTNCSIVAYAQGFEEVARWNFENAWPSKVDGPAPKADSSDYLIEEITLVHEGMIRDS